MKKKTKKLSIKVDITTYTDRFGKEHVFGDSDMESILSMVSRVNDKNKKFCEDSDTRWKFDNFKVDPNKLLKYNENNKKDYEHFVYHYCRNFYSLPVQRRGQYGYNWDFEINYDPLTERHLSMIDHKELNKIHAARQGRVVKTVRDRVLFTLCHSFTDDCGENRLIYVGDGKLTEFFDFILDSGMFTLYEDIPLFARTMNTGYNNSKMITLGAALVMMCYRLDSVSSLDYLVNEKGLDLNKIESKGGYVSFMGMFLGEYINAMVWNTKFSLDDKTLTEKKLKDYEIRRVNEFEKWLVWVTRLSTLCSGLTLFESETDASHKTDDNVDGRYRREVTIEDYLKTYNHGDYGFVDSGQRKVKLLRGLLSKEFIENNTIADTPEIGLVKGVIESLKGSDLLGTDFGWGSWRKINDLTHDSVSYQIRTVTYGGYYNNEKEKIKKRFQRDMGVKTCLITNLWSDYEVEAYGVKLDLVRGNTYLWLCDVVDTGNSSTFKRKATHVLDVSRFIDDPEAMTIVCKMWLSGEKLTDKDIQLTFQREKQLVLNEIEEMEKKICELKTRVGQDCNKK